MTTLRFCLFLSIFFSWTQALADTIQMKIEHQYLNFPIAHQQEHAKMTFGTEEEGSFWSVVVRLAPEEPDYWVFYDVSHLHGQTLTIDYQGDARGLQQIYQADQIEGQNSLYKEENRPQFHFTTKRGWINDPNGLIFYQGEYHLFYQHNPMEREWENMHWGHAVSKDLVHWEELPTALYPDETGTMFSGSAVIDYENIAGFNQGNTPAMIAFYTAMTPDRQVQCMAYSLDKGRTWTKYDKNPLIDSKEKWNSVDTRDPKVFWYPDGSSGHWVMVLNERDGHSIYTSDDLKDWTYSSHVTGFWECPELFELAVDGQQDNKKWVMYGASGTYMIGNFDGKVFTPENGKFLYTTGAIYAAQTFSNVPDSDGRRIQIGWGRIQQKDMPFNGMMLLPTELTLRQTQNGPRLFSQPVAELSQLFQRKEHHEELTSEDATAVIQPYSQHDRLRIKATLHLSHATDAGLSLFSQQLVRYDLNANTLGGMFYSPEDPTSMDVSLDIYVDRTSVEVFVDGGRYSYSLERQEATDPQQGYRFWGNDIRVKDLEIFEVKSIWP